MSMLYIRNNVFAHCPKVIHGTMVSVICMEAISSQLCLCSYIATYVAIISVLLNNTYIPILTLPVGKNI